MGEYKPLFFAIGTVLVLGFLLPLILQDFIDVETYEHDGFLTKPIENIQNGITLFGFNIDIFGFLGDDFKGFIVNQLIVFAIIPAILSVPLIIMIFLGIVYTVLKLLPTT